MSLHMVVDRYFEHGTFHEAKRHSAKLAFAMKVRIETLTVAGALVVGY